MSRFTSSVAHPTSAPSTSTATNTSNHSNAAASTDGTTERDGDYRISAEYDVITDPATGETDGYVRIRLDQTAEDQLTGYNRPEHLRAFPETDPVFADIQRPLRSSAESANRTIDDHLPRERLHHFGFEKNQLSMLAWQTYRNAQTEAVFAPSHADTPPPLERTG
jgi:hypothetical protein